MNEVCSLWEYDAITGDPPMQKQEELSSDNDDPDDEDQGRSMDTNAKEDEVFAFPEPVVTTIVTQHEDEVKAEPAVSFRRQSRVQRHRSSMSQGLSKLLQEHAQMQAASDVNVGANPEKPHTAIMSDGEIHMTKMLKTPLQTSVPMSENQPTTNRSNGMCKTDDDANNSEAKNSSGNESGNRSAGWDEDGSLEDGHVSGVKSVKKKSSVKGRRNRRHPKEGALAVNIQTQKQDDTAERNDNKMPPSAPLDAIPDAPVTTTLEKECNESEVSATVVAKDPNTQAAEATPPIKPSVFSMMAKKKRGDVLDSLSGSRQFESRLKNAQENEYQEETSKTNLAAPLKKVATLENKAAGNNLLRSSFASKQRENSSSNNSNPSRKESKNLLKRQHTLSGTSDLVKNPLQRSSSRRTGTHDLCSSFYAYTVRYLIIILPLNSRCR
jgi:hypothetical protein